MNSIFSRNLRNLRMEKRMTQEQAADRLGVSAQSVSRWETGATAPDILLLPEIAALYGVLVDDLFRPAAVGYANLADRLLAVFEKSRRYEDFVAAAKEFDRLTGSGQATADDWRGCGVIHEYMVKLCRDKALDCYDRAMDISRETDSEMYHRTKRQKNLLRAHLGQGDAVADEQRRAVEADPDNAEEWVALAAACHTARRFDEGLRHCEEALRRFPEYSMLHVWAGDCCRALGRYEEAFLHWEQALAQDDRWMDAMYSMGFCHEELGQWQDACNVWKRAANTLLERGLDVEAKWPAKMAEKCRARMKEA